MKHHFKYASGYINIDEENLYLTSSGNWQETQTLLEKSSNSQAANRRRITGNSIFLYGVLGTACVVIVVMVGKDRLKFGLLLLLFFGLYKLNQYFKREMGNRYKIPLSKIDAAEQHGDGLKISFRNADNQPDHEIVRGIKDEDREMVIKLLCL